ncbi:MAG: BTAD domain-containing putative transcriptional regulator [Acidimicrobiia bacterium]|nr:BTAD domain-containing putative transcriptional regulator [Acidimicrobiia bacterium]
MLRVLGAVEIDGRGPIRSRAQRTLLAALILDAGTSVSSDRLCELVWKADQPEHRDAALQNHVSRLRKVLPDGALIETTGMGYRLDVDGESDVVSIDVADFEAAVLAAAGGGPTSALDDALLLWRGTPFAELDDDRAQAEAARVGEMLLAAREMRAESLIGEGRIHEAIGELERQHHESPLRDRTVRLLMLAQVDAGRKSDALATFRAHRTKLIETLGLDPSPELRELEVAILNEEVVAGPVMTAHPGRAESSRAPTSVSLPTSTFIGRDADLAEARVAVGRHRIVTLLGPGGVGKTRLALHVAAELHDVFDVVAVVELASLEHGAQIADSVATALDLPDRSGLSSIERVIDATAQSRLVIVLDNCEHLIDAAAEFVDELVRGTQALHVVATSRESLNVDGELVLRVRPLAPDGAAARLFADRAAMYSRLPLDDAASMDQIKTLCRALDGLPLAIELAAARCASMTLDELIDGLDERFVLFAGGRRTAPDRHRSLRALVEWSVRSLGPELEAAFIRTAVFSGSFTVAAAAAVTGMSERSVQVALAELIDRSLLVEHVVIGRSTRYAYLETIRTYAAELLAELPDASDVIERHDAWILSLAEEMAAAQATARDVETSDALLVDLADLRTVQTRFSADGDADRSLRLCCSIRFVAMFRMHAEMFRWIRRCADQFGAVDHPLAEEILAGASIGSWQSGDLDGARRYALAAEAIGGTTRAVADSSGGRGLAAHEALADVAQFAGDNDAAVQHFERAVATARDVGDALRVISDLADLAMARSYARDSAGAAGAIDEALELASASGSVVLRSWVAYAEGEVFAETDPDRAATSLVSALDLAHRSSAQFVWGVAGLTLVGLEVRTGDPASAIPRLIGLIERWRRGGAWVQQWITLRMVVDLLVRLEEHQQAAIVLGAVRAADDSTHPSGSDARRLESAATAIELVRDDAEDLYAFGASIGQRGTTDLVVDVLRDLGAR